MAPGHRINRLTALQVTRATAPGLFPDGRGLYLQVAAGGARSWIFRYRHGGKRRDMGLGSLDALSLADARHAASDARRLLASGQDPIEVRKSARAELQKAATAKRAKAVTFKAAAEACIEARKSGWRNAKHASQWTATLQTYVLPTMGGKPVADVDTPDIVAVLEPIWTTKAETASRVRSRIETVLDFARVKGWRTGENPARWRGHLEHHLPKRSKSRTVTHHPALPYARIGAFMADLRARPAPAARALELLILSATRTGEIIGARGKEFDLPGKVWAIPGARTKTGQELRVPLSAAALDLLADIGVPAGDALVFPSEKKGKRLSSNAMLALLDRMGRSDITVHGFRSSFRDWAAETTNFPNEVAEMALGHTIGDSSEAAYRRGELFDKRRKLMEAWAKYCAAGSQVAGNVTPLKRKRG